MTIREFMAGHAAPHRPALLVPMTAPARVAAYHALSAIDDHALDLPSALAEGRRRLLTPGTGRWPRRSCTERCGGGARSTR